MKKLMLCLLAIMTACKAGKQSVETHHAQTNFMTTQSGVKIEIKEKGNGIKPSPGDRITVHYTGKLQNGTKFDSSVDRGEPFVFNVGTGQVIKGWDEAFSMLQQGDKAILTIPPDAGYGSRAVGTIPANSTLIFEVELLRVSPKIVPTPYNVQGKDTVKLPSGLQYIMVKEGTGKAAVSGATVAVHYSGYLEDGSMFDSSVERGEPISFRLGEGRVIQGWEQGIALLKTGSQCRLIIPYQLGYGEQGYPPVIPAKSTLIFDVELLEVN